MPNPPKNITDEQTGQVFEVVPERWFDVLSAWISAAYSLAVIGFLAWVALDTWSGTNSVWNWAGLSDDQINTVFKLIVYTAVGGGMGAAVNNIRGFVSWHAERRAFGWRFIWKYVSLPPLGATLAVLVYGILQGGMAVFNGGNVGGNGTAVTSLSAWATGTLAGYGCHKVFIWLDDKVNSFFKVDAKVTTKVPDVVGKSQDEAKQAIEEAKLKLGQTTQETTDAAQVGQVIRQDPPAGKDVDCDTSVDIVVGVASVVAPPAQDLPKNGDAVKPEEPAQVPGGNLNPQGQPAGVGADPQAGVKNNSEGQS